MLVFIYNIYSSLVSLKVFISVIIFIFIIFVYNAYSSLIFLGVPAPAIVLIPIFTLSSLAY